MTRKEVHLCSLPPDCLRLILSKVDYGRNRQALWALSGSCKTVREALRECPAVVELFGKWNRKSLLSKIPITDLFQTVCCLGRPLWA